MDIILETFNDMKAYKKTTSISFDADVYDALNRAAKGERRTMSSFLNSLLSSLLLENKTRLND